MNKQARGAFTVALSAIFFGSYGLWSRMIGTHLDNFFQVYIRSLLILLFIVPLACLTKSFKKVRVQDRKWIVLFTLSGSLTVAPVFYSFNKIGIGSSTLLFYASFTIVSFILGFLFFKEKITITKLASLLLALCGLMFIFELNLKGNFWLAAVLAALAGVAAGVEVVFTKKVSNRYSALQLNVYTWSVILLIHLIGSFLFHERQIFPYISLEWIGVVGYAIASLSAFFLVIKGYKYVDPAVGALTGLLEIVVGIVLGLLFFSEALTAQIVIGGAMIILAAALPNIQPLILSKKKKRS